MRAIVLGGGIAGLAAAVELAESGADTELWEAAPSVGGKLAASPFAGLDAVDEAADAYLTRVPHAVAFAARLGVTDLVHPTGAHASVWHHGLHDLPGGLVLGVPTAVAPFVTTRLLSWRGKLRAGLEPLLPARAGRQPADHDSIGTLVRGRFGDEVHDRLVDALVGSIYAADTDRSSLAAVPQLAQLAGSSRSLLLGARHRRGAPAPTGPLFAAPRQGMAALTAAAAGHLAALGATVRTATRASAVEPHGAGWAVTGPHGVTHADQVVLATPAAAAATLLRGCAPDAAGVLAAIEYADVAMVTLAVPGATWPDRLAGRSGYLVPKTVQRTVTAASFGSQKWAHWQPPSGDQVLRISLGRDGLPIDGLSDDELLQRAVTETGHHLGIDLQPTATRLTRWVAAFPQYRPHHHRRVAEAAAALPTGLHLAGASYHGIGVPACIASGTAAARAAVAQMTMAE